MGDRPKQPTFFVQDPFTEEVNGPLDAQQLKQWFAQGAVGDWGVSKSPSGPWTPASKVKGLAVAGPAPTSSPIGSEHSKKSGGGVSREANASQRDGAKPKNNSYEDDADSWGKLLSEVFTAVINHLRENSGQRSARAFLFGGAAIVLIALGGIGFIASAVLGSSVPAELVQNSGEADGAYRNRIAKDVLSGVWQAEKDTSEPVVMPDGSSFKLHGEQLVFKSQPSQASHGFFYGLSDYDGKGLNPPEKLEVVYRWEVIMMKTPYFGGPIARVMYSPTEGPDFPSTGSSYYDLAEVRLRNSQAIDRPVLEFILKDKDTLVQKNASSLDGPFVSFGDKVWRRVR